MKKTIFISALALSIISIANCQPFNLSLQLNNLPYSSISIGSIKGDDFTFIDSIKVINGSAHFQFPENSSVGIYRIKLGQTTYAKVMNEPPQQLDFIFNHENIQFETNFKTPLDSLKIFKSKENKLWFKFLKEDTRLNNRIKELEAEVDYYWLKSDTANAIEKTNHFNQIQIERELYITELVNLNKSLFASKLINWFHEPLKDGYLSKKQRNEFYKNNYLSQVEFSDESLIQSSVFTDKIFNYLITINQYKNVNEEREKTFTNAVDLILSKTNKNEKIQEFLLDYLVNGFEILKLDKVIDYIAENYTGTTCQTDEYTTLERKLEAQKMKVGKRVPNFILKDINNDDISFSASKKKYNLIIFWASWCPHCLDMLPQLKPWINQNKQNLEVFAISIDTSSGDWSKKVFELGIESFHNLCDFKEWEGETTKDYNIFATPTMFLVDENYNILAKPITIRDLYDYSLH